MYLIGNVKNKCAVIIDDIADTCGTILEASLILKRKGAKFIMASVSHAILSKKSIENLRNSRISSLIVTNSLPISKKIIDQIIFETNIKIVEVDISEYLANYINESHNSKVTQEFFHGGRKTIMF